MSVLNPLRISPGAHQISLRLHPQDLGTVDATVVVRNNHIVVELAAANPDGHQALAAALPDLRQQLQAGGQQATVLMSGGGPGTGGGQPGADLRGFSGGHPGSGPHEPVTAPVPASSTPTAARSLSSVDVRL